MTDEEKQENETQVEEGKTEEFTNSKVLQELAECKDKYLRLLAESENMRKRMTKEKQDSIRYATESLFVDLLDPIDNFENALKFAQGDNVSSELKNWAMGFSMILGRFKEILSENGIEEFVSVGTVFDPHRHQAVEIEESESEEDGLVIQEFVKGYAAQERTIRPARVKVAKRKQEAAEPQKDS